MVRVKSHIRTSTRGKRYKVKSYNQKRKSSRGNKTETYPNRNPNSNTYWLKNSEGEFTGRANKNGNTTSSTHTSKKLDRTGTLQERRLGRVYGRYKQKH